MTSREDLTVCVALFFQSQAGMWEVGEWENRDAQTLYYGEPDIQHTSEIVEVVNQCGLFNGGYGLSAQNEDSSKGFYNT